MVTQNYIVIKMAIKNKHQIIAMYKGKLRKMCPHVIGHTNGKEQALFYQFAGESNSKVIVPNSPDNWRCIEIAQLSDIIVIPGEWHTSSNHSRAQHCVHDIDLEVDWR